MLKLVRKAAADASPPGKKEKDKEREKDKEVKPAASKKVFNQDRNINSPF